MVLKTFSLKSDGDSVEPLLRIKNLSVGYKTHEGVTKVLDNVNMYVYRGEKVGLIGESGAGKTTLLNTILRILPPNARVFRGEIVFNGVDLLRAKKNVLDDIRRSRIGIIFQDPMSALNPFFKVRDQLYDALRYSKFLDKNKKVDEKVLKETSLKMLKEVALPDAERVLDSFPFQLSGGMRQRVCIALALTRANDLLLADEPTTNLDVTIQEQILNLLRDLVNKRKLAVILVTHALGMLKGFVDRIYVIYAGQIVEVANTNKLFSNPQHPYTRFLLESAPRLTGEWRAKELPERIINYINPPKGCRFSVRCPYATDRCKTEKPQMIEISSGHFARCWLLRKV